jgi:hypothetical protein
MPAIVVAQIFASAPIPPFTFDFPIRFLSFFFGWVGQRDFFFQTKNKIRKCNFRSVVKLSELQVECRANECLKEEEEKEEQKSKCTSQTHRERRGLPSTGKVGAEISSLCAYCASRTVIIL